MSRYANDGTRVVLAAPSGGVTAGDFVLVGGFFGCAMGTAAEGVDFVLAVGGTYATAPKVAGTAWTAGDLVSWVTGSSAFGVSTTLDVQAVVLADALSAATTASVRLLDAPLDNPARLTAVETLAGDAATEADLTTAEGRITTNEGDILALQGLAFSAPVAAAGQTAANRDLYVAVATETIAAPATPATGDIVGVFSAIDLSAGNAMTVCGVSVAVDSSTTSHLHLVWYTGAAWKLVTCGG